MRERAGELDKRGRKMANQDGSQVIIAVSPKNVGVAIILTVLFGPLGMFYSTIAGGAIMLVMTLIIGFVTLGFGLILTWPVCVVWAAMAASSYNKTLMAKAQAR